MNKIRTLMSFIAGSVLATVMFSTSIAAPQHGIAMHGEPALPADFKNLPYANPDAPQGGALRQAITGTFDSTSPFIVKGTAAAGVRTYVFESLMGRNWDEAFSLYGLLAESIDVSDDRQTFTFKIRPRGAILGRQAGHFGRCSVFDGNPARQGPPEFQEFLFEGDEDRNTG